MTSADVKYAFERDFNPNVAERLRQRATTRSSARDKSKGGPISGIETPDKTTIVFHLTKNFGATFVQALTLPGSAPVPPRTTPSQVRQEPVEVRQRPDRAGVHRAVHDQELQRRAAA